MDTKTEKVEETSKKRKKDRIHPHSESFDTIVHVIVGPEKKSFAMHKELLCEASPFFKAAFDGGFLEAKEGIIKMPEEDVATFKHFQFWLYSNKIYSTDLYENDIPLDVLTGLYIFAETRGIPLLQNAVIDAYIDKRATMGWVPVNQIARIYDFTCETSPLRRLYVDFAVKWINGGTWFTDQTFEQYTKQYLFDVLRAQCDVKIGSRAVIGDFQNEKSRYHVAVDG